MSEERPPGPPDPPMGKCAECGGSIVMGLGRWSHTGRLNAEQRAHAVEPCRTAVEAARAEIISAARNYNARPLGEVSRLVDALIDAVRAEAQG